MEKHKVRKFLPSLITPNIDYDSRVYVETGFIAKNGITNVSVELAVDLSPDGASGAMMIFSYPHKGKKVSYNSIMDEEDAKSLLKLCVNRIKYYEYRDVNNMNIIVKKYTLGLVIIEIDVTRESISTIPDYCGREITGDSTYDEINLINLREELRLQRDKVVNDKKENDG